MSLLASLPGSWRHLAEARRHQISFNILEYGGHLRGWRILNNLHADNVISYISIERSVAPEMYSDLPLNIIDEGSGIPESPVVAGRKGSLTVRERADGVQEPAGYAEREHRLRTILASHAEGAL
ncbi:hypothetical protein FOZ60_014277 [Perkinsus olseni]|uniref:Uncharacterized protein n=1 Tax=Perkinsus olseni TaxID=32597 RepID=A0A7J6N849_PEROL|nr:hypothetical protein FOZ60_014277 [Perkinsus olseni]